MFFWLFVLLSCRSQDASKEALQAVLQQLCTDPCAGTVTVFRDQSQQANKLLFTGDISRCSHTTDVYTDAKGKELLHVSDRPSTPEQQKAIQKQKKQLLQGVTKAERISCNKLHKTPKP